MGYKSFSGLLKRHYEKAKDRYPKKPQFCWEICSASGPRQGEWLYDALFQIPQNYKWIKGAVFDVMQFQGAGKFGSFDPTFTNESTNVVKTFMKSGLYHGALTDGSITIDRLRKNK